MYLELRHDVMGGFGKTYIEEKTVFTDDDTVKKALATLRKEHDCAFWIQDIGDPMDYNTVTAICVTWDTIMEYNSKVCTIRKFYGAGNKLYEQKAMWNETRRYLKQVIKSS